MQHSGFFNSVYVEGTPDRTYNANDYRENLAVIIGDGVLRSENDDLKVTAGGMAVNVGVGRAWINGAYYLNDSVFKFDAVSAPAIGSRIDRVMLRFDNSRAVRDIHLVYTTGIAAANPVAPDPVRSGDIWELVLADVLVGANATNVVITDKRDDPAVCGWVYSVSGDNSFFESLDASFYDWFDEKKDTLSSVTLFKRYNWSTTLDVAGRNVQFNIPQYDPETCFLEVYVNGILDIESADYTINTANSLITFSGTLVAGTEVVVKCYKSIDGTGIQSVADEITELQNRVDAMDAVSRYTYKGRNHQDNWALSVIAQAILNGSYDDTDTTLPDAAVEFLEALGGNTYLAALPDNAQIEIDVVGKVDASIPVEGAGSSASRYRYFSLGQINSTNKKLTFDFSKCEKINLVGSNIKRYIIFYGTDLNIRGANVEFFNNGSACHVEVFAGSQNTGNMNIENCRVKIDTTGTATISENGTFTNCDFYIASATDHALMFVPRSASLVRVIGGKFRAYAKREGTTAAIFYTYATETDAVAMAYNISCPVVAVEGYFQSNLVVAYSGKTYINGVVSTLGASGTYSEIVGQVQKSKP